MARLTSDLRFALRQIMRSPGFAITAVVTLALAIGANTAIFTLLNQALLRALPVKDPNQLVVLSYAGSREGHKESQGGDSPGHDHYFSYPMYRDLRDNNKVFSGLAAAAPANAGVSWNNRAEQVPVEMVSGNYFQTLGVQPAAGRLLLPSDETTDKANPVVVLSFDYWTSHLAQAPVVGKTLLINGYPFNIVGVAAPGFHTMVWGRHPDLYVPITMQTVIEPEWTYLNDHRSYWLNIVGRLHPGETPQQAMAGVNPLWVSLRTNEFPLVHDQSAKSRNAYISQTRLNLDSGARGFSPYRDNLRTPLLIMMGMVVLVMAMAIVNVASLLLVRAASRVREFSMRFALGATNGQIFRQLLAEGLLLGISSAALGLFIAPRALASSHHLDGRTQSGLSLFRHARLAGSALHCGRGSHCQPVLQPRPCGAILESASRRVAQATDRDWFRRRTTVPPHLRGAADRLQPVADRRRGPFRAHHPEPAQRRSRLCHGSSAHLRSCAGVRRLPGEPDRARGTACHRSACRIAWSAQLWEPPTMPISQATTSTAMSLCLDLKRTLMKNTKSSFPGSAITTCKRSVFPSSPGVISPLPIAPQRRK